MRILVAKCFGLGNAIMCVPSLKALYSLGHEIDVLVGTTSDDVGAYEVFSLLRDHAGIVKNVWRDCVPSRESYYDLAIQSIPYDGRWQNKVHFFAREVMDGRTRPDPLTTGLISWKRHEVEYQMDNVFSLGYNGSVPDCSFCSFTKTTPSGWRDFYLGVGYKKDRAGFWKQKHWGNEHYAALVKMILNDHPLNSVITTGDTADLRLSVMPIMRMVNDVRFCCVPTTLAASFDVVASCGTYVGNDTGMMHVAAAADRKVLGLFFLENSVIKSHPWCRDGHVIDGFGRDVTPEEVFEKLREMGR